MSGIEGWNGLVVDKPLGRKEHAIAAFLHADLVRQMFFVEAARGRERKHIDSDEDGASVGGLIHYWRAASASERPFKPARENLNLVCQVLVAFGERTDGTLNVTVPSSKSNFSCISGGA
ncbi:MAG: hypothetical protein WBG18_11835 [Xanthobacteraceae bacterium]|jgi:hypothetical protein